MQARTVHSSKKVALNLRESRLVRISNYFLKWHVGSHDVVICSLFGPARCGPRATRTHRQSMTHKPLSSPRMRVMIVG